VRRRESVTGERVLFTGGIVVGLTARRSGEGWGTLWGEGQVRGIVTLQPHGIAHSQYMIY
jgi:hypothetical protein